MLPPVESRRALLRLFRKRLVVTLDPLLETLRTPARMSVFRRLSSMDYLTSYSHAGRYYTLRDIPKFDEKGLWHHLGVSFSQHGSLKCTVEHIVNDSQAGQTHPELESLLGVRVHNTLLDLVEEERIGRTSLDRHFLYVSRKRRIANAQIKRRQQELEKGPAKPEEKPASETIIQVLLEIIHRAKVQTEPSVIVARLAARGINISAAQVATILEEHGL